MKLKIKMYTLTDSLGKIVVMKHHEETDKWFILNITGRWTVTRKPTNIEKLKPY